jgi:hypothetical protein
MRQLNYQMQDVAGNGEPERSPRLLVHASVSTSGATTAVVAYQQCNGCPARRSPMPAWFASEISRAITNGIGRSVALPDSSDHHHVV